LLKEKGFKGACFDSVTQSLIKSISKRTNLIEVKIPEVIKEVIEEDTKKFIDKKKFPAKYADFPARRFVFEF
jgi:hypothetical protein